MESSRKTDLGIFMSSDRTSLADILEKQLEQVLNDPKYHQLQDGTKLAIDKIKSELRQIEIERKQLKRQISCCLRNSESYDRYGRCSLCSRHVNARTGEGHRPDCPNFPKKH